MTDTHIKPATEPERLSLSVTQVLASVLAAVSASVAASVFGVAGTVIGAGLGSAITVVGSAVYALSLKRSHNAVRRTLDVAVARRFGVDGPDDSDAAGSAGPPRRRGHRLRLALTPQRLALGTGGLFVLTLILITGFELLTGQPVAATVSGNHGSGASVLGGTESKKSSNSPAPSVSQSPSSVPVSSSAGTSSSATASESSGTPAPKGTVTETPSASSSATTSATSSPSDTSTGSASVPVATSAATTPAG